MSDFFMDNIIKNWGALKALQSNLLQLLSSENEISAIKTCYCQYDNAVRDFFSKDKAIWKLYDDEIITFYQAHQKLIAQVKNKKNQTKNEILNLKFHQHIIKSYTANEI